MQTQLIQNRCCTIGCFLNNSSKAHAHYLVTLNDSAQLCLTAAFTVYMENSLRFEISLVNLTEVKFAPK